MSHTVLPLDSTTNPLDIDGRVFDCEAYLSKLLKEKNLNQLIVAENEVTREVHNLDSDMQTLVYENYNKFISATDTIRKMKVDFVKMEEEVEKLTANIDKIDLFSKNVSDGLNCRRNDMQKLVKASGTLKQLEFVFKLPDSLQTLVQQKDYLSAIKSYNKALQFIRRFENVAAFVSIANECSSIMNDLKDHLKDSFKNNLATSKELSANVSYLTKLGENPSQLAEEYLHCITERLKGELAVLEAASKNCNGDLIFLSEASKKSSIPCDSEIFMNSSVDILDFIDSDCSNFLSNLSLMIASCNELFPTVLLDVDQKVDELLRKFLCVVDRRFVVESTASDKNASAVDCVLITRALDRFYRRVQATSRMLPPKAGANVAGRRSDSGSTAYEKTAHRIVAETCARQAAAAAESVKKRFEMSLTEVRQRLALMKNFSRLPHANNRTAQNSDANPQSVQDEPADQSLPDLLTKLEKSVAHDIKSSLASLLQMTTQDLSFVGQSQKFVQNFGFIVRQRLVVHFFDHVVQSCRQLVEPHDQFTTSRVPPSLHSEISTTLIILLAKFCHDLAQSTVGYLLDLCEQQFRIAQIQIRPKNGQSADVDVSIGNSSDKTVGQSAKNLETKLKDEAQFLIDRFVAQEGFAISQMLVKSVETRDWLGCVEPKSVRAVMKRVVEDFTSIDWRLGQFLEEGKRTNKSSDSSRRTFGLHRPSTSLRPVMPDKATNLQPRHHWSPADSTLSTTLGKLWTERVDYFSSVQFNKLSALAGVAKICLKTLLESVRLKTFGKFGLQQMQVDVRYLQTFLWRFVDDESMVDTLLDEVVSSATGRCVEPQLMDPSVVELICERG